MYNHSILQKHDSELDFDLARAPVTYLHTGPNLPADLLTKFHSVRRDSEKQKEQKGEKKEWFPRDFGVTLGLHKQLFPGKTQRNRKNDPKTGEKFKFGSTKNNSYTKSYSLPK